MSDPPPPRRAAPERDPAPRASPYPQPRPRASRRRAPGSARRGCASADANAWGTPSRHSSRRRRVHRRLRPEPPRRLLPPHHLAHHLPQLPDLLPQLLVRVQRDAFVHRRRLLRHLALRLKRLELGGSTFPLGSPRAPRAATAANVRRRRRRPARLQRRRVIPRGSTGRFRSGGAAANGARGARCLNEGARVVSSPLRVSGMSPNRGAREPPVMSCAWYPITSLLATPSSDRRRLTVSRSVPFSFASSSRSLPSPPSPHPSSAAAAVASSSRRPSRRRRPPRAIPCSRSARPRTRRIVPRPGRRFQILRPPVPHVKVPDAGIRVRVGIRAISSRPAAGPRPPPVRRANRRAARVSRRCPAAARSNARLERSRRDPTRVPSLEMGADRTLAELSTRLRKSPGCRARRPRIRPRHRRLNLRVHPSNVHPRARAAGVVVADRVIGLPVVFVVVVSIKIRPAAPSRRLSASSVAP